MSMNTSPNDSEYISDIINFVKKEHIRQQGQKNYQIHGLKNEAEYNKIKKFVEFTTERLRKAQEEFIKQRGEKSQNIENYMDFINDLKIYGDYLSGDIKLIDENIKNKKKVNKDELVKNFDEFKKQILEISGFLGFATSLRFLKLHVDNTLFFNIIKEFIRANNEGAEANGGDAVDVLPTMLVKTIRELIEKERRLGEEPPQGGGFIKKNRKNKKKSTPKKRKSAPKKRKLTKTKSKSKRKNKK